MLCFLAVALGYSSLNLLVAPAPDSAVALGREAADAPARRARAARARDAAAGARLSDARAGADPAADAAGAGAAPGGAGSGEVPDIGDMDIVEVNRVLFGPGGQFDDAR